MFGIAGIYQPLTLAAGMETLSRMLVILAHRGPEMAMESGQTRWICVSSATSASQASIQRVAINC
jgi:hypothetical protein